MRAGASKTRSPVSFVVSVINLSHILTTSQLLGSNLGEGGAVRDNAGAAVCMVGAALKASVGAKRTVSGESFPVECCA